VGRVPPFPQMRAQLQRLQESLRRLPRAYRAGTGTDAENALGDGDAGRDGDGDGDGGSPLMVADTQYQGVETHPRGPAAGDDEGVCLCCTCNTMATTLVTRAKAIQ
jgi:hypothetical protein